tara:strand:- start:92 stop:601 length:510 start_codon:yes stop_codon:yes gene_type:complete
LNKTNLVPFGVLVKPHGLKGYISIRFFNKESRLLKKEDRIFFNNDVNDFLIIKDINYNSKNNLIRFFECINRNEVEKFNNTDFYIDKNIFPKLSDNENYFVDFIGCILFDQDKNKIGIVKDVIPIKGNDILMVNTASGQKMVPFAKDLILFFDKNDKQLVMMIHKGMFE